MSAGHAQWIVTVRSLQCDRYSAIVTVDRRYVAIVTVDRYVAIVAVVYLRWFIQEGLPKELLNKRR
jgi:hypothetical protein